MAVIAQKQGFADDADGICLIGSFKGDNPLCCDAFVIGFRLTGQDGAGDVIGAPATAEGRDGHNQLVRGCSVDSSSISLSRVRKTDPWPPPT